MVLTWMEELSVGNAMIDREHQTLLDMANGVVRAIESEDCSAFSQAFELFEGKLRAHYANEENIARTVNFPYAQHKHAEQYFLRELDLFKQELLSRKCECCADAIKHYSDALRGLLIDHITVKDMPMKPLLQNYPYDSNLAGS